VNWDHQMKGTGAEGAELRAEGEPEIRGQRTKDEGGRLRAEGQKIRRWEGGKVGHGAPVK